MPTQLEPLETSHDEHAPKPRKGGRAFITSLYIILFLVVIGTWAVYQFGPEHDITINGRDLSELEPWEVVGGVIIAILATAVALIGGLIALVVSLAAAVLALLLAAAGVAVGLFFTAGVLLGPALLLVGIILLFRRGKKARTAAEIPQDE